MQNYSIDIVFAVLDPNGNEIADVNVFSEVKNGVLALAEEKSFYELQQYSFNGHTLVVKQYTWYPVQRFKPNKG